MNLDEQIGWQSVVCAGTSNTGDHAILASLRELKRLRAAVDALVDAYANEGPIVAAQRYSELVAVRQGGGE